MITYLGQDISFKIANRQEGCGYISKCQDNSCWKIDRQEQTVLQRVSVGSVIWY